jgi:Enoyl-CoA hydratase/carnithine racemase
MSDILTERSGSILRIQLNRPEKKNAMTSDMYVTLAELLNAAAKDEQIRVVLWHGAGDSFCAGNDVVDFLKSPPGSGETPQARLMKAFVNFDKPLVAAVHGWRSGRNHHADALRFRLRGRKREVPDALHQPRPGAGVRDRPARFPPGSDTSVPVSCFSWDCLSAPRGLRSLVW